LITERSDAVFKNFKKGGEKVKNKILFISLAVALALTMGLIGCAPSEEELEIPIGDIAGEVIAAADDSSSITEDQSQPSDRYHVLLDRACAIYEEETGVAIDSEQLRDALDRARGELRDEALETRLQKLVDEGKITQEEADQYLEWWQSRPDIELPLLGLGRCDSGGGMMWGGGFQTWDGPRLAG
jgi:hypothetical protein